jgi:DNA (cytosine-5)-methyltransferase 1
MTTKRRPIGIDLFAGAGGLALGFEQAGFDVVASVEYDPVHAAVHEYNFPLTKTVCADVSKLSGEDLLRASAEGWKRHGNEGEWEGKIDVVFGGPPCQGFSTIGKRLVDDARNQLVFHFFRIIKELNPRYFVMENVPGMLAGGHSGILIQLIEEFEEAGYRIVRPPKVLQAARYGVPQDRRRLFLIGAARGEILPEYPAPTARPPSKRANGNSRSFQANRETPLPFPDADSLPLGTTVVEAIGDLPNLDSFPELIDSDEVALTERQAREIDEKASLYVRFLRGLERDPDDRSHKREWDRKILSSSLRTIHTLESMDRFLQTPPGETESISRFYKLDAEGLSNTLRAGTGSERGAFTSPRPIHPFLPRVISVREAARLHSFPDWFRFHKTKWHGFRQIGNSVPPLLGRAVAGQIALALDVDPPHLKKIVKLGDPALLELNMSGAAEYFDADRNSIPKQRQRNAAQTIGART